MYVLFSLIKFNLKSNSYRSSREPAEFHRQEGILLDPWYGRMEIGSALRLHMMAYHFFLKSAGFRLYFFKSS